MLKPEKKAVVMLSSYNGEKYIRQQIESILNQTHTNFVLYIRDDGSTDSTVSIIDELAASDSRIIFIKNNTNLGYPKCFYYLTDNAPKADYYFFSDQDDVWSDNKIESAINTMESYDVSIPVAYYGGYTICDSNLNPVGTSANIRKVPKLNKALFQVCGLEFAMAVNNAAMELLNSNKPAFSNARGTWMCMLFAALGKIVIDNNSYALYRRHESSVTSSDMSFMGMLKWRITTFFNGGFSDYRNILKDFYITVGPKLSKKDYKMVKLFAGQNYFPYFLLKIFYPKRLRFKITDEIALRFAFLIGKL